MKQTNIKITLKNYNTIKDATNENAKTSKQVIHMKNDSNQNIENDYFAAIASYIAAKLSPPDGPFEQTMSFP